MRKIVLFVLFLLSACLLNKADFSFAQSGSDFSNIEGLDSAPVEAINSEAISPEGSDEAAAEKPQVEPKKKGKKKSKSKKKKKNSVKTKKSVSPLSEFELGRYQYCGNDSDCVISINGCCDCANGGVEVSVNKERLEDFRARFDCLHVTCGLNPAVPACLSGVVSCVNHKCKYFDRRFQ